MASDKKKEFKYHKILALDGCDIFRHMHAANGIAPLTALKDGKFLYTVMELWWQPDYPKLTAAECYFPPALLENPSADTVSYFHWVVEGLQIATAHKDDPEKKQALAELLALADDPNLRFLKEANP